MDTHKGYISNRVLKIQVGFLLSDTAGKSRDTEFDVPTLRVSDDLTLDFLRGKLHLSRTSRGILVQGTLHSQIGGECVRCLNEATVPLDVHIEELFVYPPEPDAEFTVSDDGILDLAPLIREETILDMPIGILCRPECAGLCPTCGKNLNDGPCDCEREDIDPRLSALKALKESMQKKE
jgi:uncharacterized protein